MKIALAQTNPIVGDVAGNAAQILAAIEKAHRSGANVLITSELALIGYPPRDLLLREGVVESCEEAVKRIAHAAGELHVLVGHPRRIAGRKRPFCNSVSVCHRGSVVATADKQLLPGYDVFDEDRYFEPGQVSCVVEIHGARCGILICEDLWRAQDVNAQTRYPIEPLREVIRQKASVIFSLNASPFVTGKWKRHLDQLSEVAKESGAVVVAVNQVGGNDDLVFDGRSVAVDPMGRCFAKLRAFDSDLQMIDLASATSKAMRSQADAAILHWSHPLRELFFALVLGMRDYVHKTGHEAVLLGLSGGIDSALTAVLASAAVGSDRVYGVMMPSQFSSQGSIDDSRELARRLNLASCQEAPIERLHDAMKAALEPLIGSRESGVTDENVQSRLRGILLMALSNAHSRSLVLATGNKSEIATGYCTLYGDMCGAIAPLGDVLKTRVYELSRWINANHRELGFEQPPIPENSLTKAPSAELRPNQTDQDMLPPYAVLDEIVMRRIEQEQSTDSIIAETGFDESLVTRWTRVIDQVQYKRDQAAVILKTSPRAFGRGRPMPIVMKHSAVSGAALREEGNTTTRGDSASVVKLSTKR